MATCIFNLVIDWAPGLSPELFERELGRIGYDVRRLGVLVSIVRGELEKRGERTKAEPWATHELKLMQMVSPAVKTERLLPHLPSIPGRPDALFIAWGFEYPGIVRDPEKYLRKAI